MRKTTISEIEFIKLYGEESKAVEYFESLRWPDGRYCPDCGSSETYEIKSRPHYYKCKDCRKQFSCKGNTIMQSSPIPVSTWLYVMYKISVSRKGISSLQLAKEISVTQKTAWFMLHRIKDACGNEGLHLSGIVEVDETYIGGKEKNKHANKKLRRGRGAVGKQAVVGLRERGGKGKALSVNNTDKETLQSTIQDSVLIGSAVYTDEFLGYTGLGDVFYDHESVKHSAGEYVKGMAHTNGIESFWAVLKHGIYGVHHHVSNKHLHRYVNEVVFRLNEGNVKNTLMDRIAAICVKSVGITLSYDKLTKGW